VISSLHHDQDYILNKEETPLQHHPQHDSHSTTKIKGKPDHNHILPYMAQLWGKKWQFLYINMRPQYKEETNEKTP
jgi:hypothetical protein